MKTIFWPQGPFRLADLEAHLLEEGLDPSNVEVEIDVDLDENGKIEATKLHCSMPEDEFDVDNLTMIYLGGSKTSYRCICGANVFCRSKINPNRLKCNGCQATFTGE